MVSKETMYVGQYKSCYSKPHLIPHNKEIPNKKVKANFRIPQRAYQKSNSAWNIYTEKSFVDGDSELTQQSLKNLEKSLEEIFSVLLENTASRLRGI